MIHGYGEGIRKPCVGCGSSEWSGIRSYIENGEWVDRCTQCPEPVQVGGMPDTYFDKPGDHHGIYHPETGQPIFITSKAHKAYEMKKHGLSERGDRVHGSTGFDPISHRHAMESLRNPPPPNKK